jgi:mannose-1-phosphate guanylyltransferase
MGIPLIPVLLAGGAGERFWPLSRGRRPKQLLALTGGRSMIEETLRRIKPLCGRSVKPLIVTGTKIAGPIRTTLKTRYQYDLIAEPQGRDTAPAVVLAACALEQRYGESVMLVLAADHAISPREEYLRAVRYAARIASEHDLLVVFGITPSRPDTGYGYVHVGRRIDGDGNEIAYRARRFVEKPDQSTAIRYCRSGKYLWNSGMFVWKTSTILREFRRHAPALFRKAQAAVRAGLSEAALKRYYQACERISVDYAIMERSDHVAVVAGTFVWDDVGSWEAVARLRPGDETGATVIGNQVYESGCSNTIIYGEGARAVAAVGLENMVLVVTDDAVMAVARSHLPKLKQYLAAMKADGRFGPELF